MQRNQSCICRNGELNYRFFKTLLNLNSCELSIFPLFNDAIEDKEINKDCYPFGKRKYTIPATKNKKIALSSEQLKILFHSKPRIIQQEKAKDFWFFSYACNGINMKDIEATKEKIKENNGCVIHSSEVRKIMVFMYLGCHF